MYKNVYICRKNMRRIGLLFSAIDCSYYNTEYEMCREGNLSKTRHSPYIKCTYVLIT